MPASTLTRALTPRGQHRLPVRLVLLVEPLLAGHRDDPGRGAVGLQPLPGGQAELHLGAGADEDHLRLAVGRLGQHVAALGHALGAAAATSRSRVGSVCRLSASAVGPVGVLQRLPPGPGGLVGVGRADHVQARDGAQRGQVLDRLVGRAVLAEADRVVRPDVGDRQLHQRGQPHRRAHVVAEDQERAAVRAGAAVQRDAVEDRAHAVLADAEVQRAAVLVAGERPWWRTRPG